MNIKELEILIVEDEVFQRNVLNRTLKGMGIQKTVAAQEGTEALRLIEERGSIDIIICDLNMPGMDGMEFIRHLSENKISISVIIASALEHSLISSIEVMASAYGVDILGILEKPITKPKLDLLIRKYLSSTLASSYHSTSEVCPYYTNKELIHALDNEEFEPYFQPKIEITTGQIKGVEALARWPHPEKGCIPPIQFIPFMESNGLIDKLTWIMLRKAAAYCFNWQQQGLDVVISVNLSLKSLTDPNLANEITQCVIQEGISPRNIILEITESATTTYIASVLENLSRLRMREFGLSIDDYGTGYSSMQQLMRIPYTELKIDQTFVTNAALNEATRVILSSSLEMAKKLMIVSVAEGVETQEDWSYLQELHCDIAQGYFIAKPMPAKEFYQWAKKWQKNWASHLSDNYDE